MLRLQSVCTSRIQPPPSLFFHPILHDMADSVHALVRLWLIELKDAFVYQSSRSEFLRLEPLIAMDHNHFHICPEIFLSLFLSFAVVSFESVIIALQSLLP